MSVMIEKEIYLRLSFLEFCAFTWFQVECQSTEKYLINNRLYDDVLCLYVLPTTSIIFFFFLAFYCELFEAINYSNVNYIEF